MALLSRVVLENFGCFPKLDVELSPLTALVGRNDSGKSTFLKAILAQRAATREEEYQHIGASLDMPRLLWAGADPIMQHCQSTLYGTALDLHFERLVRIGPTQLDGRVLKLQAMNVKGPDGLEAWTWDEQNHTLQQKEGTEELASGSGFPWDPNLLQYFYIRSRPSTIRLHAILREFLRIRLIRLSPDALRKPSPPARSQDVPELRVDGAGLATLLSVLAGAERERIASIDDQFKKAVPTLAGFRVLPTPEGNHRLEFKLAGNMGQVEASQVSDGAMLFLGYLSLLHHPNPASVLLIEEPETGVHPGRLKNIVKLLRTLTVADGDRPAVQIVMTTHSPYLLDELSPEEVLVFRRDSNGAADAIRMDSIPDIHERLNDYSPGELWTAYEEDRLHALSKGK